jgi:CRP-like cAMP-binding protein
MGQQHAASLKGTSLCRLLSDAETAEIAFIMEERKVPARKELFHDGAAADGLYLVVSGEFEVVKRAGQRERELQRLGSGAIFGAISLLTREPRTASARACVDSQVLLLPHDPFQALLRAGSPAALKIVAGIAEVIAQRLAAANAKLVELADRLESAEDAPAQPGERELIELQRKLQVWSF